MTILLFLNIVSKHFFNCSKFKELKLPNIELLLFNHVRAVHRYSRSYFANDVDCLVIYYRNACSYHITRIKIYAKFFMVAKVQWRFKASKTVIFSESTQDSEVNGIWQPIAIFHIISKVSVLRMLVSNNRRARTKFMLEIPTLHLKIAWWKLWMAWEIRQ